MKWQPISLPERRKRRCPPTWELTRAASEGSDPVIARHVAVCKKCAAELAALSAFSARAKAGMPAPEGMSRETIEEITRALRGLRIPVAQPRGLLARYLIPAALAGLVLGASLWGL